MEDFEREELIEPFRKRAIEDENELLQGGSLLIILLIGGLFSIILKLTQLFSIWFGGVEYCLLTLSPIFLAFLLMFYSVLFEKRLFLKISEKKIKKRTNSLINNRKVFILKAIEEAEELEKELSSLEKI